MNHYVLTSAYRGPDYPLDANARRIALLRGITARSLAAQAGDWTWLAFVAPDDPLREDRLDALRSAGHTVIPVTSTAEAETAIDWSEPVLTTRIDDDDGFARGAFARLRLAVTRARHRTAYIFPVGYRINNGLAERIVHIRNAWSSLYAPEGDRAHIRQVVHPQIARLAPVQFLDNDPAWLWVRHQDAQSGFRRAHDLITPALRATFPVDWDMLAPRIAA
jgi:hypothetical protein